MVTTTKAININKSNINTALISCVMLIPFSWEPNKYSNYKTKRHYGKRDVILCSIHFFVRLKFTSDEGWAIRKLVPIERMISEKLILIKSIILVIEICSVRG